jgi:hypothetical protein
MHKLIRDEIENTNEYRILVLGVDVEKISFRSVGVVNTPSWSGS